MRILTPIFLVAVAACTSGSVQKRFFTVYPAKSSTYDSFYFNYITQSNIFNLSSLSKGVDSFEIRIWPWDAFQIGREVFIFKVDSNGWLGYHYFSNTLPIDRPDGTKLELADNFRLGKNVLVVKKLAPICGWEKFVDSINTLHLASLPVQDSIKDFKRKGHTDGDGYLLEIATPVSYRQIYYDVPEWYDYDECKRLMRFADLLQRQLGDDFRWPMQLITKRRINFYP